MMSNQINFTNNNNENKNYLDTNSSKTNLFRQVSSKPKGVDLKKNNSSGSNFFITPRAIETSDFYSRVNTSPAKGKITEARNFASTDRTVNKIQKFPLTESTYAPETNFTSPNFSIDFSNANKQSRFSSFSQARTQVRLLITEGEVPTIKIESKPSLNSIESRNKLIAFSKTKNFEEDKNDYFSNNLNNDQSFNESFVNPDQIIEEKENKIDQLTYDDSEVNEEYINPKTALMLELQKKLPVPIDKKDDEIYKILKMREMKRESLPSNKSARTNDLYDTPPHQKSFNTDFDFSLCKKKRLSYSAKKKYSSSISLEDPVDKKIKYRFPVYRDNEMGINEYWQAHIIESKADEDLPTDNDQLALANHMSLSELRDAIETVMEQGLNCLRNKKYISLKFGGKIAEQEISEEFDS